MKDRTVVDIASAAKDVRQAAEWSTLLEDREAAASGVRVADARRVIARRVGVMPGTLENLRGGRLKSIASHIFDRLRGAVLKELELEAQRLEHEISILRQAGEHPAGEQISEVVASLAKVRQALGLDGGGK